MAFVVCRKNGEESTEEASRRRLWRLVDNCELSFYQIASRIGTSGVILSMWLAGAARPDPDQLTAIERFLKG
jgi:DNA transposition AAA+ family ATPase